MNHEIKIWSAYSLNIHNIDTKQVFLCGLECTVNCYCVDVTYCVDISLLYII